MENEKVDEKGLASRVEELEKLLRKEWWLNHCYDGHRYGDDGEMQCCGIDFKRMAMDTLHLRVDEARWKRLAGAHAEEKPND